MDERGKRAFREKFDGQLKLEFHGAKPVITLSF